MFSKDIVRKVDQKIFHGWIKRIYKKGKKILSSFHNFYHGKSSIILREPVSDMIMMQNDRHENKFGQYMAYDFAVRYLAIENYYGKNDFGFELYRKMHTVGGNYGEINQRIEYVERKRKANKKIHMKFAGLEQHSVNQFKTLIRSVEQNGFDIENAVLADRNLLSIDGSHRSTLAVYLREDYINVEITRRLFQRRFTLDWFWKNGFEREEIQLIEQTMQKILQQCHEKTGYFFCILFPPAEKYFEDITRDLGFISPDNIKVVKFQDYEWETGYFKGFLKGIYHFDSIMPEDLERKMYYILRSSDIKDDKVKVRIVTLNIKDPMYRLKTNNGMPESVATVRMKDMIRGRYKIKEKKFTEHYVKDYAHDVIIHSTDNFISNHAFQDLLEINQDLSLIVHALDNYEYALAGVSDDKMSRKFPKSFFFDDDIDIFVKKENLEEIVEDAYKACCNTFKDNPLSVEIRDSAMGKRIYVMYKDFIVTMLDFMTTYPGLREEIITEFLSRKKVNCEYSYLAESDEIAYRVVKYLKSPDKIYHRDFIVEHITNIHQENILNCIDQKSKKNAEQFLKSICKA